MPDLNDFRKLALVLPPSEFVAVGEVGSVLSALVAHSKFGDKLVEAANEGHQQVLDFYHEHAVADAEARGVDAPQRGQVLATGPVTSGPAQSGPTAAEFAQLQRNVQTLLDLLGSNQQPPAAVKVPQSPPPDPTAPSAPEAA